MHILKNALPIRYAGGTIQPGEWLCNDDNAFQLAMMGERGTVEVGKWTGGEMPAVETIKSILLIRSGAIGDLLLLSPCIEPLKKKYPNAHITLCCFGQHATIMQDFGVEQQFYPLAVATLANFDLVITLENVVELSTEKGQHATDAYAEAMGVTVTDYRPVYKVRDDEIAALFNAPEATVVLDRAPSTKRVALQLHASSQVRGYPMKQWGQVMHSLVERGWEIMLLGNMDGIKGAPDAVKDCSKLSFREAAAVLSTCDVFCGVDSSFFNLCPALGVPAIGLFGPVDWRTRVKEGSGQRALRGQGCSPCGWTNTRAGVRFPPMGPCFQKQQCVILEDIKPERIVAAIEGAKK